MIIWHVRRFSGYGKEKLKRFFLDFVPMYNEMCERYELGATDNLWLYTRMLKEEGIDIEEWCKEIKE